MRTWSRVVCAIFPFTLIINTFSQPNNTTFNSAYSEPEKVDAELLDSPIKSHKVAKEVENDQFLSKTYYETPVINYNKLGGFDRTHTLAICQKYIIDENVVNGDFVGTWLKTWTWMSDGAISFSLVDDLNGSFAIHSATGVITIADASKINGKIVQQDTIFNLLVRTTDAIHGYEIDTARIRVKENSFCRYIDLSAASNGTGLSRSSPWKGMDDASYSAGYGYFLKRGSVAYGEVVWLQGLIATEANPTVFAAYGIGRSPVFDGTGAEGRRCFTIGSNGTSQERIDLRSEFLELADIEIKDYDGTAINVFNWSESLGFYNMYLHNNDRLASQAVWAVSVVSDLVIGQNMPHEWINCVFDTTGNSAQAPFEASFLKIGCGPTHIYNCYFGWTWEMGLRIGGGNVADEIKHCLFDAKHQLSGGNEYAIQMRDANVLFEDIIIKQYTTGVFITSEEVPWHPYNAVFRNFHIYSSSDIGIQNYPASNDHNRGTGYVIENSLFEDCITGVDLERDDGTIIRRSVFRNNTTGINTTSPEPINTEIHYNVFYDNTKDINLSATDFEVFRNTADGIISTTNSGQVRGNFYRTLSGGASASSNLDLDDIVIANYFTDFTGHKYTLKSTAALAIDHGYHTGISQDIIGSPVPQGSAEDVGAHEYLTGITEVPPPPINNPPTIIEQAFLIKENEFSDNAIGHIIAGDIDAGQILTYTILSGNENGIFNINSTTGELSVTTPTIFEDEISTYLLTVMVSDNGKVPENNSASITITFLPNNGNIYLDPTNVNDPAEDGSMLHPFDSWDDITWTEGNNYLQKCGTTAQVDHILIGANYTSLGSYGDGAKPVIESPTTNFVVRGFEKSNISISNLSIRGINSTSLIYFLGAGCDNIIVEKCVLESSSNGIRIMDGGKFTSRYNTFSVENDAIYSTAQSNFIFYNIFKKNSVAISVMGNSNQANIYNNVFYDNSESVSTTYAELVLYNNIFYMPGGNQYAIRHQSDKIVSDHNIYYPVKEGFIEIKSERYNDLQQVMQQLKIDLHSFNSDPVFVDMYSGNFGVRSGSPAINSGIQLNLDKDYSGKAVPYSGMPDIGALEYTGLIPPIKIMDDTKLTLFPNPSSDHINIEVRVPESMISEKSNIRITDLNGREVLMKISTSDYPVIRERLELSGISEGIYFVVFQIADKLISEKFIIRR